MNGLIIAMLVVQIILALILVVVVLFQNGNQAGLSGSIAGGAETFFGKNKGRTLDAKLKKWTSVVAILFLISSIVLSFLVSAQQNETAAIDTGAPVVNSPVEVIPADGETAPVEVIPQGGDTPDEVETPPAE